MKLIDDWRKLPRMYSVWAMAMVVAIQTSVSTYITPEMLSAHILLFPDWTYDMLQKAVTAFLGITGMIGRAITQDFGSDPSGPS